MINNRFNGQSARYIAKWFAEQEIKSEKDFPYRALDNIIQQGANANFVLLEAAKYGYLLVCDYLLNKHQANASYAVRGLAISHPNLLDTWLANKKDLLIEDEIVRARILGTAIRCDETELNCLFKQYAPKGPCPSWFLNVALEGAGINGDLELINKLISRRGNKKYAIKGLALSYQLNTIDEYLTPTDKKGHSPVVMGLAMKGDLDLLKQFFINTRLSFQDYVPDILMGAGAGGHSELIEFVRPYHQKVTQDIAAGSAMSEGHFVLLNYLFDHPLKTAQLAYKAAARSALEFGFVFKKEQAMRTLRALHPRHRKGFAQAVDHALEEHKCPIQFKMTLLIPQLVRPMLSPTLFSPKPRNVVPAPSSWALFLRMLASSLTALFACCLFRGPEVQQPIAPGMGRRRIN